MSDPSASSYHMQAHSTDGFHFNVTGKVWNTFERSKSAHGITRNEFDGWPRSGLTRAVITEGFILRCKCQLIHP